MYVTGSDYDDEMARHEDQIKAMQAALTDIEIAALAIRADDIAYMAARARDAVNTIHCAGCGRELTEKAARVESDGTIICVDCTH